MVKESSIICCTDPLDLPRDELDSRLRSTLDKLEKSPAGRLWFSIAGSANGENLRRGKDC